MLKFNIMNKKFVGETWTERDHLEDQGVDGRYTKMDIKELGPEGVDWIHLTLDWDQWHGKPDGASGFRNTCRIFWLSEGLFVSQEQFYSTELASSVS
jgi:hypothetical protein